MGRMKPSVLDKDKERQLQKIATRSVTVLLCQTVSFTVVLLVLPTVAAYQETVLNSYLQTSSKDCNGVSVSPLPVLQPITNQYQETVL